MTQKTYSYDVISVCNALVDILVHVEDEDIKALGLRKGHMHLVSSEEQKPILERFSRHPQSIELGGSSLNAMRALAVLGQKVAFAGMIGQDHHGQHIRQRLEELNIRSFLLEHPKEATGVCLVLVTEEGERTMITSLGASRLYEKSLAPITEIAKSKIFHFCGYQWDTPEQKEAIRLCLASAEAANCFISFDFSDPFVVKQHFQDFEELFSQRKIGIVFANEEESKIFAPQGSMSQKLKDINKQHCPIVVTKLGSKGACVEKDLEKVSIPALKTTVVDTTGAGDMFAGGFLFGYLQNRSLKDCGYLGAHLAKDVISRMGASLSDEAIKKCHE